MSEVRILSPRPHRLRRKRAVRSMARARILRPAKSAMQSGTAVTRKWILEYEPARARSADGLGERARHAEPGAAAFRHAAGGGGVRRQEGPRLHRLGAACA